LIYPANGEDGLRGAPRLPNHTSTHSSEFLADARVERYFMIFPFTLGVLQILTNRWIGEVDDKITFIDHTVKSVSQTVRLFLRGVGKHEIPPLYDIILQG